jgi:hypothetical protein
MNSVLMDEFRDLFRSLQEQVQEQARHSYKIWKHNPFHPSLHFKQIHSSEPLWSVRIGLGWRALGLRERDDMQDTIYWFWIGSHADYDRMIRF